MQRKFLSYVMILFMTPLVGCGTMDVTEFKDTEPTLVLEDFFAGETRAWGIFEDRFGNLRRQFSVDITGTWDGRELVLDERFVYDDGERDRRVWTIEKLDAHSYQGRADDVIGIAEGQSYGNAFSWQYTVDLKMDRGPLRVKFDDWMFLQPDGVLINRARVTKWGIEIGEVTLVFSKAAGKNASETSFSPPRHDVEWRQAANQ